MDPLMILMVSVVVSVRFNLASSFYKSLNKNVSPNKDYHDHPDDDKQTSPPIRIILPLNLASPVLS
jgi:hypothetical protein